MYDTGTGHWLCVAIRRDDIEDVGEEIVELALGAGLIVLDPQEGDVITEA